MENENLRLTIGNLETQVGDLQCSKDARIHGLKDTSDSETVAECVDKFMNFVSSKLEVHITKGDLDIAHRLGKFNREKPRNIIVKFTHRRKRNKVIKARSKLKKTGYMVFEDLTKINQQVLKDAYKLQCVKNSYITDGHSMMRDSSDDHIVSLT
ncbi:uncharacterized protein LOC110452603 [Mizuhopecten yessoensis]|uniref:uncharacterized protein LOC110452603 n=1 Tax=Mizuhopecten yessoensis TaxID=6573 RepID=UPI000B459021|nr:uncharacterized protein LOC110452603 [Mizuhopecten yessoensis]